MRSVRGRVQTGDSATPCPSCGGFVVTGSVSGSLLGTPRFSYRLKTVDVSVDVAASMCESCGLVVFRVPDPTPIRQARAALQRSGATESVAQPKSQIRPEGTT